MCISSSENATYYLLYDQTVLIISDCVSQDEILLSFAFKRIAVNSVVFSGVQAVDVDPSDRGYLIYSVDERSNLSVRSLLGNLG